MAPFWFLIYQPLGLSGVAVVPAFTPVERVGRITQYGSERTQISSYGSERTTITTYGSDRTQVLP